MIRYLLMPYLIGLGVLSEAATISGSYSLLDEGVSLSRRNSVLNVDRVALNLPFQSERHEIDQGSVLISHRGVKERWEVRLGGKRLGFLDQIEQPSWTVFEFSQRSFQTDTDRIEIIAPTATDAVDIASISVVAFSPSQLKRQSQIDLKVSDDQGGALPSRITVLDNEGFLAPLMVVEGGEKSAFRTGVVYQSTGAVSVGLAAGSYQVFVNRGPEYERAVFMLVLKEGERRALGAQLLRSVDTSNWISSDPHTHTFTNSRHGDATIEERVITIAGEALELPIATDHNILTDYQPAATRLGLTEYFTPVIGDEVTTKEAHFNVFPLRPDSRLPDFRILDWKRLLGHFRQDDPARIVILNHPHNVHNGFRPFDRKHFNPVTGRGVRRIDLNVDAMEVLSSSAQQTDMMLVFRDWFALLNQGYRVVGLGTSDVHDVNRYIIGQGRTYLAGNDLNPGAIVIEEACQALREGRALISMGLFVNMTVNQTARVGDTVTSRETTLVEVDVQSPSWLPFDRVMLFANGSLIRSRGIGLGTSKQPDGLARNERRITWRLSKLKNDTHLIAMATGPGNIGPSWPIPRPYQGNGERFIPRVAGATNPIWIDSDGDGKFSAAREIGERLWNQSGKRVSQVLERLVDYDSRVMIQVADLALQSGTPFWDVLSPNAIRELGAESLGLIEALRAWDEKDRVQ